MLGMVVHAYNPPRTQEAEAQGPLPSPTEES